MDATIIAAIVAAVTSIVQAFVHYFKDKRMKILEHNLNHVKEEEIKTNIGISVLNKLLKISVYARISNAVSRLIYGSNVDRLLIFVATNGVSDFRKVAIIFEKYNHPDKEEALEREEEALALYRSIVIDEGYRKMLKDAERWGNVLLQTSTMPESMLKNIYINEGVNQAVIYFLFRKKIDDRNDVLCFCSAGTIAHEKLTEIDKTKLELIISGAIIPALLESIDQVT